MKSSNKPYRGSSILMLVVFLASIVLPASLSAATLFCDMPMGPLANSTHLCCTYDGNDSKSIATDSFSESSCAYQQLCSEAISSDQNDSPALPQFTKNFVVAFIYSNALLQGDSASTQHPHPQLVTVKPQKNQPLFLLNSTFLN